MTQQKKITIVAFGDSITEASTRQPLENRWPEIVRLALEKRFPDVDLTLINAGVGGNTTREGLLRIDQDVIRHHPDVVLVEFNNDVTPEEDRHVPYAEYTANLDRIRKKVWESSHAQMVLIVFPPVIDAWHTAAFPFLTGWRNGGQDAALEYYRELMRQFARDHNLPIVHIDQLLRAASAKHGAAEYTLDDGCHLTASGNRVVADAVLPVLVAEIERRFKGL